MLVLYYASAGVYAPDGDIINYLTGTNVTKFFTLSVTLRIHSESLNAIFSRFIE